MSSSPSLEVKSHRKQNNTRSSQTLLVDTESAESGDVCCNNGCTGLVCRGLLSNTTDLNGTSSSEARSNVADLRKEHCRPSAATAIGPKNIILSDAGSRANTDNIIIFVAAYGRSYQHALCLNTIINEYRVIAIPSEDGGAGCITQENRFIVSIAIKEAICGVCCTKSVGNGVVGTGA
jgi:hypothetical protein